MYILDIVVYDRNLYFGLGPIPKPKPKLTDTFGEYHNRNQNHISKGESSYRYWNNLALVLGIFSIIKGPLKPNLLPDFKYFWIIFNPQINMRKIRLKWLRKKQFRLRYQNWTLVWVPDTKNWFRSYTNMRIVFQRAVSEFTPLHNKRHMDYVRDGEIQGQCTFKKTKERPCISPSLT